MNNEYSIVQATSKLLNDMTYNLTVVRDNIAKMEYETDTSDFTAEQREEYYRLRSLADAIEQVVASQERKDKPVKAAGKLRKNSRDRYEVDGYELTSGATVDYYDEDYATFFTSRVEYSQEHGDYYIVGLGRGKSLEGVNVRIK